MSLSGRLFAVPITHLWELSYLNFVTSGILYCGPGVFCGATIPPEDGKRSAFPKEYMGFDFSSAKINFPKDVYDFFLICSSCSLSIYHIIITKKLLKIMILQFNMAILSRSFCFLYAAS